MKNSILISFLALAMATAHLAQGQGAFGGGGRGGGGAASVYQTPSAAQPSPALQRERNKRSTTLQEQKETNSNFVVIDASVLMNVKADEFVAVFGVVKEATTVSEATTRMDATIAAFKEALRSLGVPESDLYVDFVIQNRIYAWVTATGTNALVSALADDGFGGRGSARVIESATVREVLAGYEVKRNVSIHYRERSLFEKLLRAAARLEIHDLVKVDCIVRDIPAVQAQLREEAGRIIKDKVDLYRKLGVPMSDLPQIVLDNPSIYYPDEQYSAYTAAEAEAIAIDNSRVTALRTRKSRTFYFNPLLGDGFDVVVNPVILEPVVQFTLYMKAKYAARTTAAR